MQFVRSGPRYVFIRTNSHFELEKRLLAEMDGREADINKALELAEEESAIVFITPVAREKTRVEDARKIIYFPILPLGVITQIINSGITDIINKIDMGPGQLVMRIPSEEKEVIEEIKEAYNASQVSLTKGINRGEAADTILSFTDRPIRNQIESLQLVKENLLISGSVNNIHRELRRDAIQYITHGLEDSQWYELKINIYDAGEKYKLQHERLVNVLSDLEAGIILGETWTRDHGFALFSVVAYQVKLFTILKPEKIKKILLGLEYDKNGERIVDYDLYYKNDKISWFNAVKNSKRSSRQTRGRKLRKQLEARLSEPVLKKIEEIENKLS